MQINEEVRRKGTPDQSVSMPEISSTDGGPGGGRRIINMN